MGHWVKTWRITEISYIYKIKGIFHMNLRVFLFKSFWGWWKTHQISRSAFDLLDDHFFFPLISLSRELTDPAPSCLEDSIFRKPHPGISDRSLEKYQRSDRSPSKSGYVFIMSLGLQSFNMYFFGWVWRSHMNHLLSGQEIGTRISINFTKKIARHLRVGWLVIQSGSQILGNQAVWPEVFEKV